MTEPETSSRPGGPGPPATPSLAFLDAALGVPAEQRLACFDNDGTLWCERRPTSSSTSSWTR